MDLLIHVCGGFIQFIHNMFYDIPTDKNEIFIFAIRNDSALFSHFEFYWPTKVKHLRTKFETFSNLHNKTTLQLH